MTVMGEVLVKELSDAGSIPARSIFSYVNQTTSNPRHGAQLTVFPPGPLNGRYTNTDKCSYTFCFCGSGGNPYFPLPPLHKGFIAVTSQVFLSSIFENVLKISKHKHGNYSSAFVFLRGLLVDGQCDF